MEPGVAVGTGEEGTAAGGEPVRCWVGWRWWAGWPPTGRKCAQKGGGEECLGGIILGVGPAGGTHGGGGGGSGVDLGKRNEGRTEGKGQDCEAERGCGEAGNWSQPGWGAG